MVAPHHPMPAQAAGGVSHLQQGGSDFQPQPTMPPSGSFMPEKDTDMISGATMNFDSQIHPQQLGGPSQHVIASAATAPPAVSNPPTSVAYSRTDSLLQPDGQATAYSQQLPPSSQSQYIHPEVSQQPPASHASYIPQQTDIQPVACQAATAQHTVGCI